MILSRSQIHVFFVASLFAIGTLISVCVPSFQSPDEFEHITRAYLLGKGDVVLSAPQGQSSGGLIDSGLARYMDGFTGLPFKPDRKLSSVELDESKKIQWSGQSEFRPALGMAYYFPGIYVVHMVGLKLGESLKWSIDTSYKLCRLLLLLTICFVLFYSFQLYPPPPIVLALLIIPMSLFQFASASLDGIATVLAIFIVSAFLKMMEDNDADNPKLFYALIVAWLLVASSRLQLFPLILLAAMLGYVKGRYRYFVVAGLSAIAVIAWQVIVLKTVVDGRIPHGVSSSEVLSFYLSNPLKLWAVLASTLADASILKGYLSSFFGLLGWLDTPFKGSEYKYLCIAMLFIALVSIDYQAIKKTNLCSRALLVVGAIGSLAITFLAMLVTWTPHPAVVIEGVQGRYFLIPLLMVGYALAGKNFSAIRAIPQRLILFCLLLLGVYSGAITIAVLIERYFLPAV